MPDNYSSPAWDVIVILRGLPSSLLREREESRGDQTKDTMMVISKSRLVGFTEAEGSFLFFVFFFCFLFLFVFVFSIERYRTTSPCF
jgi:hypothetical protein